MMPSEDGDNAKETGAVDKDEEVSNGCEVENKAAKKRLATIQRAAEAWLSS
ncbi:hypothetical protein PI124_g10220 [Phytophthora idaei]|nr:hypothetical protein PI125_g15693 [Phytophthora idaei]KAG3155519.1 hypothetical protein PI126_g9128 [Phytophthora idaei]KAG3245019.1 hypothetical protein PI124_g10220 [Phytophthora idaei]